MPEIPETRLAEIEALCAEIAESAERIRTQDNAGTSHPYFVVYEGDPNKSPDRWRFVSPFLTRDSAEAFILRQRHNLRRPFVFVESAHANHEIRAAREVFAALPELTREVRRLRAEAEKLRAVGVAAHKKDMLELSCGMHADISSPSYPALVAARRELWDALRDAGIGGGA